MPRIKNLLYAYDYEDIAASFEKAEQDAIEAVKSFAKTNKDILICIARWGDGNCGYIAKIISEEIGLIDNSQFKSKSSRTKRPAVSKKKRNIVFDRFGNKCINCGGYDDICIDHIVPLSLGGLNCLDNMQPLCRSCNSKKGVKTIDYRK